MKLSFLFVLLVLGLTAFAGCLDSETDGNEPGEADPGNVFERDTSKFVVGEEFSYTLTAGEYGILPGKSFDVSVQLPSTEGVYAALGPLTMNLGLFLPEIPGCDWTAAELPAMCNVPVIADIGPYYSASSGAVPAAGQLEGDSISTIPGERLGRFLIENYVPHGFAVAQVSVFGTGDSGFCQDLMGLSEQLGIDAVITWLGSQPWSNGAVGVTGRSYDGGTAWEAATFGNPYLKTIVPISGVLGQHDLMWRNGSAEFRGPGVLYALYAAMTPDGDAGDLETACTDYAIGGAEGVAAYAYADAFLESAHSYWGERDFTQRVLKNYKGSVWLIHGLQDWNVDSHQAFPMYEDLKAKGLDVRGLFGQWGHMYPDRSSEHSSLSTGYGAEAYPASVRYDWAEDMLNWFNFYLKGSGPQPELWAEVQDNMGAWRVESSYPPEDAVRHIKTLSAAKKIHVTPDVIAGPKDPVGGLGAPVGDLTYNFGALSVDHDVRISGNTHLSLLVTPVGPGGGVYAELVDLTDGLRLGHATMDLRYYQGGKVAQTVVPGQPILAKMEFFVMDVEIPAGHEIGLILQSNGMDYLPSPVATPVEVSPVGSYLKLPIIARDSSSFFTPPTI